MKVCRYLPPMWDVQVSTELIRMAILWHEMWHEALEEASRQYFGESNVEAMLNTLMPLHEMMARNGPTTLKEIAFVQVRPLCRSFHVYVTHMLAPAAGIAHLSAEAQGVGI